MEEFVWALKNIDKISPQDCRDWALRNFALEKVAKMYEEYFQAVLNIHTGAGWYEENPGRTDLDYNKKHYPRYPDLIDYDAIEKEEKPCADHLALWFRDKLKPKKVFDIGCGPGMYVYSLDAVGVNVEGLDIDPRVDGKNLITQADMLTLDGTKQADCVIMFEVAEHIDPMNNDKIVDGVYNTVEEDGVLIFTAAQPGQGGVGHINCRPRKYWLDKFLAKGMIPDIALHESLHNHCMTGWHMGWFINNVMVLRKPGKNTPKQGLSGPTGPK